VRFGFTKQTKMLLGLCSNIMLKDSAEMLNLAQV